jgi:hypothetical protein
MPTFGRTPFAGARNTLASAGSPALLAEARASSGVRPNGHARPGLPTSAPQGAPARRPALPSRDGDVGASRLARKHVSFRRLQKLDSGRHGAAAAGEQSPVAAARRFFDRKIGVSAGGGESRARSGWCQPARRTTGRRAFSSVSNHGGVRLKWCDDELNPTRKEQVTWLVISTVLPRKGWLSGVRARCRKAALNEQGTRGARRKALNRSELECLSLGERSRTSLSRRLPRPAALRGVSVPEVRFESFASVPVLVTVGNVCDLCGQPSPHATRLSGRPKVTPVNNEGVSPSSCARTHGGGEETTTLR